MDKLELSRALFGGNSAITSQGQTTTTYGIATGNSEDGSVVVDFGGDTVNENGDQSVKVETTFPVKEGDPVIVSLVGADGTGKAPVVTGVVGRGDELQNEITEIKNYFWTDEYGAHVSTINNSVQGANVLLDSDSLDIRNGTSNSESDQTVYASFGREVTVGSRKPNTTVGSYSQVFGYNCEASGAYSHAEGSYSRAIGNYSHAEGDGTASGRYAHAEGNSIASGQYAHAEGQDCTASGDYSHAEGRMTNVIGQFGHGEGFNTYCNSWSHTEGYKCQDFGACNHLEGLFTRTSIDCRYQHVQGIANVEDNFSLGHTYLDIIGNGEVSNADYAPVAVVRRSNAYNLDRSGNAEFQGEVYVGGCTPNGETPYPVIRYNTSNSHQEYYDKANSAWAQVPGGGGYTTIWTNSDPTSNYAAKTEAMDLSAWTWIGIYAKFNTSTTYKVLHIVKVGDSTLLSVPNLSGTQYFAKREAAVSTTGITYSTGYRNTTGTTGTQYAIPLEVVGIC